MGGPGQCFLTLSADWVAYACGGRKDGIAKECGTKGTKKIITPPGS